MCLDLKILKKMFVSKKFLIFIENWTEKVCTVGQQRHKTKNG